MNKLICSIVFTAILINFSINNIYAQSPALRKMGGAVTEHYLSISLQELIESVKKVEFKNSNLTKENHYIQDYINYLNKIKDYGSPSVAYESYKAIQAKRNEPEDDFIEKIESNESLKEKQSDDWETKIEKKKRLISLLDKKIDALSQRVIELSSHEGVKPDLSSKSEFVKEKERLLGLLKDSKNDLSEVRDRFQLEKQKYASPLNEISNLEKDKQELTNKKIQLTHENKSLSQEKQRIVKEINQIEQNNKGKIQGLDSSLSKLRQSFEALNSFMAKARKQIMPNKERLSENVVEKDRLAQNLNVLIKENERLRKKISQKRY